MNEDPLRPDGGLGVHVRDITEALCEFDIESTVLSVDRRDRQGGFWISNGNARELPLEQWVASPEHVRILKIMNLNEFTVRHGFCARIITDDLFVRNALALFDADSFDVIHCHDSTLWRVARVLAEAWRLPTVLTCHLSFFAIHPPPADPDHRPFWQWDADLEAQAIRGADALIVNSESYRDLIASMYFVSPAEINLIPNGVDPRITAGSSPASCSRPRALAMFVGRLVPSKGVDIFIDAARLCPSWDFLLWSAVSPTLEAYQPLVRSARAAVADLDNFVWLGHDDQVEKWERMRAADVGVVTSTHEPFGIVALEWLTLGVPLITTRVGGLAEFCTDANSIEIEPTAEQLVDALEEWQPDDRLIAGGRRTAAAHTWRRAAAATVEVYEGVAHD